MGCSGAPVARGGARAYGSRPGSHTHRLPWLQLLRYLYGARTQNITHDPPHPCRTADAAEVAAGYHHPSGACSPWADHPPPGGGDADQRHCRQSRDQPPLCLQMGAAVSGAGCGGLGRPTGPGLSAPVAPSCPAAGVWERVTHGVRRGPSVAPPLTLWCVWRRKHATRLHHVVEDQRCTHEGKTYGREDL